MIPHVWEDYESPLLSEYVYHRICRRCDTVMVIIDQDMAVIGLVHLETEEEDCDLSLVRNTMSL